MKKIILPFSFHSFPPKNSATCSAQSAGDYMESITSEFKEISGEMWDYTSAVAHGKSARKVENRRKDVLKANMDAQEKVRKMEPFQGDKSLRDSVLSYLKLSYNIINHDYGKIVNMEEIAEQSYDAMEAYLTAEERASKKLEVAGDMIEAEQKIFASAHKINLVETSDKLSTKLEEAGKVFSYYNRIYLVFFKSYKEEVYLIDAQNKNDVTAIKQHVANLGKFADNGLRYLDTAQDFMGDRSLKAACGEMLRFYKLEGTTKAGVIINFFTSKETFMKTKNAFDAKAQNARTQADIDGFNKAVNDFNGATKDFNDMNQQLNAKRSELLTKWNESTQAFLDKKVPNHK